jgi:hypothetical protein
MTGTGPAGTGSPGPEAAARHQDLLARRRAVLGSRPPAPGRYRAAPGTQAARDERTGLADRTALAAREAGR